MKRQIVILGAGRPYRGELPSAIAGTPDHRRVLDWLLDAFRPLDAAQTAFVGGYKIDRVLSDYPQVKCVVNSDWERTGAAASLLSAPLADGAELWGCYADVVFRSGAVEALAAAAGSAVLYDPAWRARYASRSAHDIYAAEKVRAQAGRLLNCSIGLSTEEASGEFAGLWKLDAAAVRTLLQWRDQRSSEFARLTIPQLLEKLIRAGHAFTAVSGAGEWAELNAPQDLARFVLGTKAETLERLRPMVRHCVIGPSVAFEVGAWRSDAAAVIEKIRAVLGDRTALAVRSSARVEDRWDATQAGKFLSVLNVLPGQPEALRRAIESVIASYEDGEDGHEVLIQHMVADSVMSGVVLTRTLLRGGPYRIVNYNDRSADTTLVTGGSASGLRTAVITRGAEKETARLDARLERVIRAAAELEELVGYDSLDLEFAVDAQGRVLILQVRPMVADQIFRSASDEAVRETLKVSCDLFGSLQSARPGVVGKGTLFGVMPDWNPAEIIGTKPRPLAFGLYRHLVTDEVWADQRAEAGYRDIRPHPLLASFGGMPYVDVRASLNSFVPQALSADLAAKLVDHGLKKLAHHPELHDKIEFEVAFTSFDFDLDRRMKEELEPSGWSARETAELRTALCALTQRHLTRVEDFSSKSEELDRRFDAWMAAPHTPWDRAWGLIADCRKFGTPVFAHLARAAFMSVALLRSLVQKGLLTEAERQDFFQSLQTVTRQLEEDGRKTAQGILPRADFLSRYGHLRPGTYDITSSRYDSDPARFLEPMIVATRSAGAPAATGSAPAQARLAQILDRELPSWGWQIRGAALADLIRRAIEGREKSKFVFTRYLSQALEDLKQFGSELGIGAEELSFVELEDLRAAKASVHPSGARAWLAERAAEGRRGYAVTAALELPALITRAEDFAAFEKPDSRPNFVTQARVVAAASLIERSAQRETLQGRIALIPAADPGFDWLFGYGITGLITMYGGANSHMAIRAAEQNLPAAVGVGEKLFDLLAAGRLIDLDCASEKIHIVP